MKWNAPHMIALLLTLVGCGDGMMTTTGDIDQGYDAAVFDDVGVADAGGSSDMGASTDIGEPDDVSLGQPDASEVCARLKVTHDLSGRSDDARVSVEFERSRGQAGCGSRTDSRRQERQTELASGHLLVHAGVDFVLVGATTPNSSSGRIC